MQFEVYFLLQKIFCYCFPRYWIVVYKLYRIVYVHQDRAEFWNENVQFHEEEVGAQSCHYPSKRTEDFIIKKWANEVSLESQGKLTRALGQQSIAYHLLAAQQVINEKDLRERHQTKS